MAGTLSFNQFKTDMQLDAQLIDIDADNESINGSGVDMLGYQGVVFIATVKKGEAATYGLKAQQDTAAAFGAAADLLGTNVAFTTTTAADGFAFLEIVNPAERYVRPVLVVPNLTTPNAVSVVAIRYGKNWRPETNADGEVHISPAEGTA